jgi:hypothetical protein
MSVTRSLRALLAHSIDYAGMFPPCSLDLERALANQSDYVRSPEAWMLGAFILRVDQFTAAKEHLSQFDPKHPLRISALGPKTDNAAAFREVLPKISAAIRSFSAHNVDLISVNQLEMPLPTDANLDLLTDAQSIVGELMTFWETPVETAARTIALLAEHNSETDSLAFGYKLRTGGVTADAFPTSTQIAKALVIPADYQVPIKFTAGLHHPVRQFREEVQTKMHGFLNVLGAAVLAAEHRWDEQQTSRMLEDENAGSFSFDDDFFGWRECKIDIDRLEARRKFVTSFGSCSFDEPREDLRALGFL